MFEESVKGFTNKFQKNFKGVSRMFQRIFGLQFCCYMDLITADQTERELVLNRSAFRQKLIGNFICWVQKILAPKKVWTQEKISVQKYFG